MKKKSRAEWGGIISEAGVPCGPIRNIQELTEDPQIRHREMIVEIEHAKTGILKMMGIPVKLSDTPGKVLLPPPLLGEHTDEILSEIVKISQSELHSLREEKVI